MALPLRERQDVIYFTGFSLATKWRSTGGS